jgi:alkylhydroperoxidase/carboxymuconolactone decarboxylase family protein YurZ
MAADPSTGREASHRAVQAPARANVTVGNTKPTQLAALIHCYPYIGFPRAANAIRLVAGLGDDAES